MALTAFSFKIGGKDAPYYEAPAGWLGPNGEFANITNFLDRSMKNSAYSAYAADPAQYKKLFGADLPGFEGYGEAEATGGGSAKAPEQPNYNEQIEKWRKSRGGNLQTLLSGLGTGGNERLGG